MRRMRETIEELREVRADLDVAIVALEDAERRWQPRAGRPRNHNAAAQGAFAKARRAAGQGAFAKARRAAAQGAFAKARRRLMKSKEQAAA